MKFKYFDFLALVLSLFFLAGSYYAEYVAGLSPCLLCLMQRWLMILLTILFFLTLLLPIRLFFFRRALHILASIIGLLGLFTAGRQIWLSHQLQQADMTCLPDAGYIIAHFPLNQVLKLMLLGSSDCGHIGFFIWGLSMASWAFIGFLMLIILAGLGIITREK